MNSKQCALLVTALALPLSIGAAPAGCLEGRVHEGKKYGKFTAKVFLSNADFTTVELLNVMGDPRMTFSFKPGPNAAIKIDGKTRSSVTSSPARRSRSGYPRTA